MSFKKIASLILLSAMVLAVLSGCGKQSSSSGESLPEKVIIGTQEMPNDEGIAKAKDYFKEAMGVDVELVVFSSGKDVNNALLAGSVDFGLIGSCPVALGLAGNIEYQVIWCHDILGSVESLAVKNGSGIKAATDLVGKKVATPFASTAHYSLLRALQDAGVNEADVELLDMQPAEIYAAWTRGDIDAAYVWEPTLSTLLDDGAIILTSADMAEAGSPTTNLEVVRTEFAEKYPDLVVKYIQALEKAVQLYKNDNDEAVATIAKALNVTEEDARGQMEGSIWMSCEEQLSDEYFGGGLVDSLLDTAEFLKEQGSITSVPDRSVFEAAVNSEYIQSAISK